MLEGAQGVSEAGIVGAQQLTQPGPGAGLIDMTKLVAHGLGQRRWLDVFAVELQSAGLTITSGQAQQHGLRRRGGPMLDGEAHLLTSVHEVAGRIGLRMQVGAAAQGLSQILPGALGHVVDKDDGDVMLAIELTQEAEHPGDVGGTIFVQPVEPHERIEDQQLRLSYRQRLIQCLPVLLQVEPQTGGGDDVEIESGQRQTAVLTQLLDPIAYGR